jgi:hypothetical protein
MINFSDKELAFIVVAVADRMSYLEGVKARSLYRGDYIALLDDRILTAECISMRIDEELKNRG